jgi:signal peptidase I
VSSKPKDDKNAGEQLLELVVIVVVAIGLALGIQAFLVKPYRIPSPSMVPTLREGQRVLVNRIGNTFNDPKVGDIYVFHPPAFAEERQGEGVGPENSCGKVPPRGAPCAVAGSEESDQNFIKRLVAGPGDTIAIRNGRVIRNGKLLDESYANLTLCANNGGCNFPTPIKIPPDHWFMMGDNRGNSLDSRFWGPVPKKWIIGQAFATYWPPGRLGLL